MRLEKQVAIVTGGGQGIGREIALRLGREGAHVVIGDINEHGSRETAALLRGAGSGDALVVPTDITDESQVARLIEAALGVAGGIHILVNNSGIMGPVKNIEDILLEEWQSTFAVNLAGMFLCCKHVVPVMKRMGTGCIVNIGSVTGKKPMPLRTPYAASKMGVIGFTRTLAAELGSWKIRVNAICPAGVTGDRQRRVYEGIMQFTGKSFEEVTAERAEGTALKTFVDPKYIAALVAFLCSEDAAMMTGQDINVSAGAVMY
jgi:NAD(P)-dependent dehydrogenase (short-subunit alcohol dehydrogenase family)